MTRPSPARPLEHVIVTGAASGIGEACAKKLKRAGTTVTALDLVEPAIDVDHYFKLDLADTSSVGDIIKKIHECPPVDALFNIAGIPPKPDAALNILTINWLNQRHLTEGILDCLNRGGAIVNMASRAGGRWKENIDEVRTLLSIQNVSSLAEFVQSSDIDGTRAYNLSKEVIIAWTLASTASLKTKEIRMNSVSPAAVDTAILNDFKQAFGPVVEKNLAMVGRAGRPEEIADVAIFLASPESQWLKGIDIGVDGGMGAMIQSELLELSQWGTVRNL